jgi:amino acid transporter
MQSVAQKNAPVGNKLLVSEEYPVKAMPSILGTFDMTATYLLIIFFITNATTAASAGAAAFTYLILGGITYFIPSVIAAAQLGSMFPYEGSLYNWTYKAFGSFWSFFSAFCAWVPGVLVMITAGDVIVSFIQGLNSHWLTNPGQQGAVIIGVIVFSGIVATQRFRTVQNIVNMVAILAFLAVFFIGLAGVVWLVQGHPSATNFADLNGWRLNWQPHAGNIHLFGIITLAYLGAEAPLNMAGEIRERKVITKHLAWGTVFVFIGYFVATFSLLVVAGPDKASASLFSLVSIVDIVLGKVIGNVTAICVMSFFITAAIVYGYTYARLPMVAALDQHLPILIGKLNKYRVPSPAIWLQAIFASVVTFLVFFAFPFISSQSTPINLSTEVYNILLAALTLVWAFSTIFLFINVAVFYFRDREKFNAQRIFPLPLLFVTMPLGVLSCVLAVVDTLFNSWIGSLIDNAHWLISIGSVIAVCVVIAALGGTFASSEAAWESIKDKKIQTADLRD